jgi:TP901 family phage tail tape measure protein
LADIWVNILGDGSKLKGELDKSSKNVSSFSEKIGKVGKIATAAGVAVTAAFTAIVLKTAAVGDQFDKMSLRTGVAAEDLSALAYAADISGSDIGTLEKGLKALTKVMDDASRGIGEGLDAFRELDIAVVDVDGNLRSTVDVLKEAATKISAIEDPTKQAAYAMDLFGSRAGPQLLPLLKMGEEGIEDLMTKAKELGMVVSTEAATAAAEFTDRLTDLKGSLFGAGRMIGDTLIPAITPLIERVTKMVVKIKEWAEENKPLVENIFKWAAGLGVALAVIGPMLMLLPALITGVTMLSGAFLPFLITGAIVAGIIKINSLLDDMNEKVYKAQINLDALSVAKIDAEIESLAQEIKRLEEQIKITSELPLSSSAQFGSVIDMKNAVMNLEMKMGLLIERRHELTRAEEEGIDVSKEILELEEEISKVLEEKVKTIETINALNKIENDIYKLTHTAMEISIRDLDLQKQAYIDLGIEIGIVNEWYDLQIKKLTELQAKMGKATASIGIGAKAIVNISSELKKLAEVTGEVGAGIGATAEMVIDDMTAFSTTTMLIFNKLKDDFKSIIVDPIVGYLEQNLTYAITGLLGGIEDFEWSWSKFWEGLKNTLINAVAAMIAKLIILASFSWLFGLLGLPLTWLGLEKGGGVGYDFGGQVKKFQFGGVADTVPARLTVGEYVIAKPMTDFIRRFRAIPQNLIDAVAGGMPTPLPAFASGGPVGTSNITTSSFGDTNINVYISGNKISDDIDIKRLAMTVSNEILRKINLNRRH